MNGLAIVISLFSLFYLSLTTGLYHLHQELYASTLLLRAAEQEYIRISIRAAASEYFHVAKNRSQTQLTNTIKPFKISLHLHKIGDALVAKLKITHTNNPIIEETLLLQP